METILTIPSAPKNAIPSAFLFLAIPNGTHHATNKRGNTFPFYTDLLP
jgi:hypothetical protein